jgi:hypothetical protein
VDLRLHQRDSMLTLDGWFLGQSFTIQEAAQIQTTVEALWRDLPDWKELQEMVEYEPEIDDCDRIILICGTHLLHSTLADTPECDLCRADTRR